MGKQFKEAMKAMRREAKAGRVTGHFSVRADDIQKLEREGFTVTLPHNFRLDKMAVRNLWEVEISWENPAGSGMAKRLQKYVKAYCKKYNGIDATHLRKLAKRIKRQNSAVAWMNYFGDTKHFYGYGFEAEEYELEGE